MNAQHAASGGSPVITGMRVIPVAGRDSMLLNLCGAHGPYFTRNLVILKDNAGCTGVGEVPGGAGIRETPERSRPLVEGRPIGLHNAIVGDIRRSLNDAARHRVTTAAEGAILRQPHEINLRADNVLTAVEAALLDLLGRFLGVPVAALLGAGQQRESVRMLAYLFYVGDRRETELDYPADPDAPDEWLKQRHEPALTPRSPSPARPRRRSIATASGISS